MSLGLFKNVIKKACLRIIELIYIYEEDLVLNRLIYHKPQKNQIDIIKWGVF